MSGGSHEYICYSLENNCKDRMYDVEMNDLIADLVDVLHDLEWWQSGDIGESDYRKTLSKFKKKWFKGDRRLRFKGYIDERIEKLKKELYSAFGEKA